MRSNKVNTTTHATFARVYDAGGREPTLFYNLGAAQFKLGDYNAARASFGQIANDPTWGPLAQYNLGLIADKLGNSTSAQQHYRVAFDAARSEKLKQMAALKISQPVPPRDEDWFGIVSLGAGYDDNVVLLNDQSLVDVSNEADYFGEVLASASGFVQGDIDAGWRADVVGYYRGYRDLTDFDYGMAMLGMTYNRLTAAAQWQIGGRVNAQMVGGDAYTTSGTLRSQLLRSIGAFGLRARNDAAYVQGADHYGYLSGWQNRPAFSWIGASAITRCAPPTSSNGTTAATRRPRRNSSATRRSGTVSTQRRRTLSDRLDVASRAKYQFSRYDDENVEIQPDGSTLVAARDDDRVIASLRLTYHPTNTWDVFGEYAYSDNSSNFSAYEYTDNQIMLGIERSF